MTDLIRNLLRDAAAAASKSDVDFVRIHRIFNEAMEAAEKGPGHSRDLSDAQCLLYCSITKLMEQHE